jgi:hypothetical protein
LLPNSAGLIDYEKGPRMSASARNRELSARQQRVIAALLASRSITEAASMVGINERSVRRWLEQAHFRDALREAERAVLRNALGRLQAMTMRAADTLESLLSAQSEPVRVAAAKEILLRAVDATAIVELEERVERLERGRV